MRSVLEALNRPLTVVIMLALFLAVDGVLLYLYQQQPDESASVTPATTVEPTEETEPEAAEEQASAPSSAPEEETTDSQEEEQASEETEEETTDSQEEEQASGEAEEETTDSQEEEQASTAEESAGSQEEEEGSDAEEGAGGESAGGESAGGGSSAAVVPVGDVGEVLRVAVGVEGGSALLQIQEDGQVVFEQVVESGFSAEFVADQSVAVSTGDAGVTRVGINGRNLGYLGESGASATRTYVR